MSRATVCYGRGYILTLLSALAVLAGGCGGDSDSPQENDAAASAPETARGVLNRMFSVYREAKTYSDQGELHQVVIENGIRREQPPIPFEVTFERPTRIKLKMFGVQLVSDSQRLRAVVADFEPQMLDRPAPDQLSLENILGDPILKANSTPGQKEFSPPQLDLLFSSNPQHVELLEAELRLLEEKEIDSKLCYRVEAKNADGLRIYWIDKSSFVLHRVDVPADRFKQQDSNGNKISVEAWFVLSGAKIGEEVAEDSFVLAEPEKALRLTRFVMPPPDPAGQPIGHSIGNTTFYDLEDKPIRAEAMSDKVYVLEFWSTTCAPCKESFPKIEAASRELKDQGVLFYPVNTDPASVENDIVQQTLANWGVGLQTLRDRDRQLFMSLGGQMPTTVLIGPGGRIHSILIGAREDYSRLVEEAKQLLAGQDVAQQKIDAMEANFQKQLTASASRDAPVDIEIPRAQIAARTMPKQFELETLWQAENVKKPGNVLVIEEPENEPVCFVLDGGRVVVELDKNGKETNRHELPLAVGTTASTLRTAVDGDGKRYFVAFGPGQRQLHLFDAQWKHQLSYPEDENAQIADVRLADLDGDGQLSLIVGFLGVVGVQQVELNGQRSWTNREVENIWQIAIAQAPNSDNQQIWATSPQGVISIIDHRGKMLPEIVVRGSAILRVVAADADSDQQQEFCGLASLDLGRWQVVGFDRRGTILWAYDLPAGEHHQQIERILPTMLGNGNTGWLVPGADGSIHLIEHSGPLRDSFRHGSELAGLAITEIEGQSVLIVASVDGVTAWKVTPRSE